MHACLYVLCVMYVDSVITMLKFIVPLDPVQKKGSSNHPTIYSDYYKKSHFKGTKDFLAKRKPLLADVARTLAEQKCLQADVARAPALQFPLLASVNTDSLCIRFPLVAV